MSSSSLSAQKYLIRLQLRAALSRMDSGSRLRKSRKAIRTLIQKKVYRKAQSVFTYMALPQELETKELVQQALLSGKKVFVPKISGRAGQIEIFEIKNIKKDLKRGRYGILEPKSSKKADLRKLDLIIAPGLGFDREGNRLGRGLGYFDRFLKKTKHIPKIGLAFREQIVAQLPVEAHDIPMDQVITD